MVGVFLGEAEKLWRFAWRCGILHRVFTAFLLSIFSRHDPRPGCRFCVAGEGHKREFYCRQAVRRSVACPSLFVGAIHEIFLFFVFFFSILYFSSLRAKKTEHAPSPHFWLPLSFLGN